jgi:hypothetical protein
MLAWSCWQALLATHHSQTDLFAFPALMLHLAFALLRASDSIFPFIFNHYGLTDRRPRSADVTALSHLTAGFPKRPACVVQLILIAPL